MAPSPGPKPFTVEPLNAVSTGFVLWRHHGQIHLTVVVKATFALQHGRHAALTTPAPVWLRDEHAGADPATSLLRPTDLVPYRQRADTWVTGHAWAPGSGTGRQPVGQMAVRFALNRGEQSLLNKALFVYGRRASPTVPAEPFTRIALCYENAFGGPGHDNPAGRGATSAELPHVVHPDDPLRLAGFGPIGATWPARARLCSAEARRLLAAPVVHIPDGFDWTFMQAAPLEQRLPFLHGDEWIVLDGFHPDLPRVQTKLPDAQAEARIWPVRVAATATGYPVKLVADTLAVDGDTMTCSVVWRGNLPIADEKVLTAIRVAAGLTLPGAPIPWPGHRS